MPRIVPIRKSCHEWKGRPSPIGDVDGFPTSGGNVPTSNDGGRPFGDGGNRPLGGDNGGLLRGGDSGPLSD